MESWPILPEDVVTWFRGVFAHANRRVCERLVNLPNVRETSLDDGLIEALIPETAPTLMPSGAIVRMDTHNIGGLRRIGRPHWDFPFGRRWETADLATGLGSRGQQLLGRDQESVAEFDDAARAFKVVV